MSWEPIDGNLNESATVHELSPAELAMVTRFDMHRPPVTTAAQAAAGAALVAAKEDHREALAGWMHTTSGPELAEAAAALVIARNLYHEALAATL